MGVEEIQAVGILKNENEELSVLGAKNVDKIFRLSFWSHEYHKGVCVRDLEDGDLMGYVIIKRDEGRARQNGVEFEVKSWYVFEGVFAALDIGANYITPLTCYAVKVGDKEFYLEGVLYCQQNSLNKCCAQVALRSILSRVKENNDVCYGAINRIAAEKSTTDTFIPGSGLSMAAIKHVVDSFGLGCDVWTGELGKKGVHTNQHCMLEWNLGLDRYWSLMQHECAGSM